MKRVLFIGTTHYNLKKPELHFHLKQKFEGLSKGVKIFVLARGKPFHQKVWGVDFYLLPAGFFFWPPAFFLAFHLCLAKKIDTIVSQSPLLEGFLGSILKRILNKELIVEIHGDWIKAPFLAKKRKFEKLERKFIPILAKISLRSADKIRVISNYLKEKVQKIVPQKKYFIFPTFTDIDIFLNEKEIKFENFILFVGVLEKVKGIEYLIKAFAKISKKFPQFKLILVGEGSERKNLQSLVLKLNLLEKIEFKGRLSLKETKDIMKNCYLLVLPSLSEGLGRVLMEVQALGKPVIGSNIGGIPELIKDGETGFLFKAGDFLDLAEKLKILLNNKTLAQEFGKKGKNFIQNNFSNKKYIENYLQLIYN